MPSSTLISRPAHRTIKHQDTTGVHSMSRQMQTATIAAAIAATFTVAGMAQTPAPDEAEFRELYRQLVEINTTRSVGSCTQAAEAMRARLAAAGIPGGDMQ